MNNSLEEFQDKSIAIIGLGYVGLPLAIEFGKKFKTCGFDINKERIDQLRKFEDSTECIKTAEFNSSKYLSFSSDTSCIKDSNIYIVAVPTPLDRNNQPNLGNLKSACKIVGTLLNPNDVVIFESTVYPGATEEVCVPILEKESNLHFLDNDELKEAGFYCGYSPERFAPGKNEKNITEIIKVTSGSTKKVSEKVNNLYKEIILAGTVKASSIKVAEAAKVIENTQRDLNIALVNELSLIFNKLEVDTQEVIKIASTKWNFAFHTPGLVGGHCIGVDPYYLAYKAIESGIYPQLILSGREINNKMGSYIAGQVMQLMTKKDISLLSSRVLILGFTFKEDCKDTRNTKVIDIVNELKKLGCDTDIFDPVLDRDSTLNEYDINLVDDLKTNHYDAIIIAVKHAYFSNLGLEKIKKLGKKDHVLYDVKYMFTKDETDGRM
jgi:UDP-N-acetyl-D-glucosamine/UDP-N-acetyl-D-galactosamine dehydrogenase